MDEPRENIGAPADDAPALPAPELPARPRMEDYGVAPIIVAAYEAYRRDLPQLLQTHPDQWVAYHGAKRLGFAPSKTELYQRCLAQGLARGDFLVTCVEPEVDWEFG